MTPVVRPTQITMNILRPSNKVEKIYKRFVFKEVIANKQVTSYGDQLWKKGILCQIIRQACHYPRRTPMYKRVPGSPPSIPCVAPAPGTTRVGWSEMAKQPVRSMTRNMGLTTISSRSQEIHFYKWSVRDRRVNFLPITQIVMPTRPKKVTERIPRTTFFLPENA